MWRWRIKLFDNWFETVLQRSSPGRHGDSMPMHFFWKRRSYQKIRGRLEELQEKVYAIRENSKSIPVSLSTSVTLQAVEHKVPYTYVGIFEGRNFRGFRC